jgi:hypothetical protein
MKLKAVLIVSAIYLGVLGVGFMLAPRQLGIDAVPTDASPALIAYLRIFGSHSRDCSVELDGSERGAIRGA